MEHASKLIVLRGPSGAGKSTVAQLLHRRVTHKTALIDQDYYRHVMFNNLHSDLEAPRYVMFAAVKAALDHGYDVIVEGFMGTGKYKSYFDILLAEHPDNNYFFYFDVSYEQTLQRHSTRQKDESLNEARMHELFLKSGPIGYPNETIISEDTSAENACLLIARLSQLTLQSA
jgi:adenylate kinase family enzyme